jgi:hypothetical protein
MNVTLPTEQDHYAAKCVVWLQSSRNGGNDAALT